MRAYLLLLISIFISCARLPLTNIDQALEFTETPEISDDLDLKPLIQGLEETVERLSLKGKERTFIFGTRAIKITDYVIALKFLIKQYYDNPQQEQLLEKIKENFDFYAVYGKKERGKILLTSYYEPVISGSLTPTPKYSQPLYKTPTDIVEIPLLEFSSEDYNLTTGGKKRVLGRLTDTISPRGHKIIVPYYSRQQIDQQKSLAGQNLELCYIDPIDSFFLQIQGSGTITFSNNTKMRLGYAAVNGRRYVAIGKLLLDIIPIEQMSLQSIEAHLRSISWQERHQIMYQNPSYVFFRQLKNKRPITTFGTQVVDGRTIATDSRFFPKGALAFLQFPMPQFADKKDLFPEDYKTTGRFVLDHDTGGAINGGGRADLFWGKGEEAKRYAGVMRAEAKLYYLAPKEAFLQQIKGYLL